MASQQSTETINIQPATSADIPAIFALQQKTWLVTYPNQEHGITRQDILAKFKQRTSAQTEERIKQYQQHITNSDHLILVAKQSENLLGYCMAMKTEQELRLGAIYVAPEYQGQGVGSRLITRALDWLGHQQPVLVNVAEYNQPAISFYQKHGFAQTGKRVQDQAAQLPSGAVIPEIEMRRV